MVHLKNILLGLSLIILNYTFAQTAPIAGDDTARVCNGSFVNVNLFLNDVDAENDSIFIQELLGNPQLGTISFINNMLTFSAYPDNFGSENVQYVLCDTTLLCDTATILILVDSCIEINQPPVAQFDFFTVFEDLPFISNLNPLANDSDPNNDNLTWSLTFGPLNGTINVNPLGNSTYTSDLNYNGVDFFTYEVCDNGSPALCSNGFAVILVTPTNDVPVAQNDFYEINEDEVSDFNVKSNDSDIDGDDLYVSVQLPPKHGEVELVNGQFRYTPDLNYFGLDSFRYILSDSGLFSFFNPRAWVFIQIKPVDDLPIAETDSISFSWTGIDKNVDFLLSNDSDVENQPLFITDVYTNDAEISVGNIQFIDGQLVYDFVDKPCGTDTFYYNVCDDTGHCSIGTIVLYFDCYCIECRELKLPQGISPDGDGSNDALVISGLGRYRPALLQVFNRWGHIVYENDDYDNSWNGTNMENNEVLPDGSYWYVLTLSNGGGEKIQYLIIQR